VKKFKTSFQQDGLVIHVNGSSSDVLMTWQGMSDLRHPEAQLSSFLIDLLPSLRGRLVKIDLCSFDYMNSATFGPLLQFVKNLNLHMIQTQVTFNSQQEWQRVTFRCMKAISRSMSYVQIESL
jgi:hypothetical protein